MTRTITALFDHRHDAEAAEARLKAADIDADHIRIHDKSSTGYSETGHSTHDEPGLWGSIKNAFLPDDDRHTYEEGVRRGGVLLTVDVDEDHVDDAVRVLEEADTVDIDDRSQQWRSSGWAGSPVAAAMSSSYDAGTNRADTGYGGATGSVSGRDEEVIPLVEEQLVVGKREVDRGGVRVRSYVTETPVHEQIRLRNERVNVERHPVDRDIIAGDDAFRERTIDMTATGEEAVVGKTSHVVEEVVVSKAADERVEQIDDTVRRTDVEIDDRSGTDGSSLRDRLPGSMGEGSTAGSQGSSLGDRAAGLGKEALGNAKQGLGSLTGNDTLKRQGIEQERTGEIQQGKRPIRIGESRAPRLPNTQAHAEPTIRDHGREPMVVLHQPSSTSAASNSAKAERTSSARLSSSMSTDTTTRLVSSASSLLSGSAHPPRCPILPLPHPRCCCHLRRL